MIEQYSVRTENMENVMFHGNSVEYFTWKPVEYKNGTSVPQDRQTAVGISFNYAHAYDCMLKSRVASHYGRLRRVTAVDGRNVPSTAIERVRTRGMVSQKGVLRPGTACSVLNF